MLHAVHIQYMPVPYCYKYTVICIMLSRMKRHLIFIGDNKKRHIHFGYRLIWAQFEKKNAPLCTNKEFRHQGHHNLLKNNLAIQKYGFEPCPNEPVPE
jgi:hypothetical protein